MDQSLFPIVGIGASAGGIEALEAFFKPMPTKCGMAFVIVTHLNPDRHSVLDTIIGRFTGMTVRTAVDGAVVRPEEVWVIPENATLGITDGRLSVIPAVTEHRERKPIDLFFAALAMDRADYAVGVVLSGGDGDGTLGIKAIKERGGLTLAQISDGQSPRHPDMPQSAIATGLVDFAIPVDEMAGTLIKFLHGFDSFDTLLEQEDESQASDLSKAQKKIYAILRNRIGHDFSGYKTRTFNRRVYRRMQVLQIDSIGNYLARLDQDQSEAASLFRDLLINVTSFFRDPEAFEALERLVIPRLFEGRGAEDTVRIWIPGCSTGEEVFSIAILIREHMSAIRAQTRVQIFATDIDDRSLTIARAARYPAALVGNVDEKRLKRFFHRETGSYVVAKDVRDLCIFSPHSVLKDPPFSRMDMVSCRNLLIYFGAEAQTQVIPTFHYSLNPAGFLFLGTSENISQFGHLFAAIDKKHRLFRARDDGRSAVRLPFVLDSLRSTNGSDLQRGQKSYAAPLRQNVDSFVLDRFAPPHVVVNGDGDVVYYSARTGKYLEAAAGLPSRQILAMARKELRIELRTALREAKESRKPVTRANIAIETQDNRMQIVTVTVSPMPDNGGDPLFIILFVDNGTTLDREQALLRGSGEGDVGHYEQELRDARERLQSMIEEYETALEELKSSNEELVSVNEELQSTNEELEASKEELQSLNEELQTVNIELTVKVDDLDRANSDLRNLFESTQIATVFLDRNLLIRNFTPQIARLFNILPSDRGRPLSDFASRLDYPTLQEDIQVTLETGETVERRLSLGNELFAARLRPYRSTDLAIDGVIMTFFDVTGLTEPSGEPG